MRVRRARPFCCAGAELARQCSVPLTALIWAEQDLSSNLPHVDRFVSLPAVPVGNYAAEWIAGSLAEFLRDTTSFLLLLPANDCCTEVAARLSVRLGCSFLPDINGSLSISEGSVIGARTLLSGQAREVLQSNTPSVIATIVSSGEELKSGMSLVDSVQRVILKPDPIETLVRVLAVEQECGSGMPALSSARIVVAGGAGMGGLAGFSLLRELCNAIGASLAASRAAVNNGWIGPEFQVGLSGQDYNSRSVYCLRQFGFGAASGRNAGRAFYRSHQPR